MIKNTKYIEIKGPIEDIFSYPKKAGEFVLEILNAETIQILDGKTGEIVRFVTPETTYCKKQVCIYNEEA